MTTTSHYHDRITRATERLAQLQAKELLANQRRESQAKRNAQREELRRRQRVAELVFIAKAHELPDAELEAVLRDYMADRSLPTTH